MSARVCAEVDDIALYALRSFPRINQVTVIFRGCQRDGECAVGEETLQVGLREESDIPWASLVF